MLNVMSQKRKRPQMMKMHDQESVIILISENEEVDDEDGCESDNEEGEESDHEDLDSQEGKENSPTMKTMKKRM